MFVITGLGLGVWTDARIYLCIESSFYMGYNGMLTALNPIVSAQHVV